MCVCVKSNIGINQRRIRDLKKIGVTGRNRKEMQKIGINRGVIEKVVGLIDLAPPCKVEGVKSL